MKRYTSRPIDSGFKLRGTDGTERAVCPKAKCTGVNSVFVFELDHESKFEGVFVEVVDDPLSVFPSIVYEVPDDVHNIISTKKLRGVSPLITATRIDEQTNRITEYRIDGLSLQIDKDPVCPSSNCPTKFVGGKDMSEDKKTTEEKKDDSKDKEAPAKDEPKAKPGEGHEPAAPVTPPANKKEERDEYLMKLIRENEELKKTMAEQNKILKDIEDKKRAELMKLVPEDQAEFAKGLETNALATVVSIIEKSKAHAQAEADKRKIVSAGAVETNTDQKANNEGKDTAPKKDPYDNFFDRSAVLKPKTK